MNIPGTIEITINGVAKRVACAIEPGNNCYTVSFDHPPELGPGDEMAMDPNSFIPDVIQ